MSVKKIEDFSLKDALELAIQIEMEAMERYLEFARQIGSVSEFDAGAFFLEMANNEKKHATELTSKKKSLYGDSECEFTIEEYYDFLEIEAPEFDKAQSFMSAEQALQVARASEIKAFQFFDKVSTLTSNPEVKNLFLELKQEEENHRKMIESLLERVEKGTNQIRTDDDIDEPNGL